MSEPNRQCGSQPDANPEQQHRQPKCQHRTLSDAREVEGVGTMWKCRACGAFIPESAITIQESAQDTAAVVIVDWPGQSTAMCRKHADRAAWVADGMGMPRATETPCEPQECKNCTNEGRGL
jgi:ribosomal protein L37AE/L43A